MLSDSETSRKALSNWQQDIKKNSYSNDRNFRHSISYYLSDLFKHLEKELESFSHCKVEYH